MTRIRIAMLAVLVPMAGGIRLLACAVCFQMEPNATTHGVQAAVITLVAITACVLGGFAAFIVRFVRRSSHLTHPSHP